MDGLKRGAYLSHMLTSTVGHWGLCFTGFFFQGPGCRAATTVMCKRGEPQRALWLDVSSSARQLTSTHSPLAGTSFWPHAITRGQRFQFSSCRGEDKQIPAGSTRDDHRAMGIIWSRTFTHRRGNAAGTEWQRDFPQVPCPAKLWGGEEAPELGFSSALSFSSTSLRELISCHDCLQFTSARPWNTLS